MALGPVALIGRAYVASAMSAGIALDAGGLAAGTTFSAAASAIAVGTGTAAAAIDMGPCDHGDGDACVGRDFGFVGIAGGAASGVGDGLSAAGVVSAESAETAGAVSETAARLATASDGAGALGWFLGSIGTIVDIGNRYGSSHEGD
jgi:hypothetical protein